MVFGGHSDLSGNGQERHSAGNRYAAGLCHLPWGCDTPRQRFGNCSRSLDSARTSREIRKGRFDKRLSDDPDLEKGSWSSRPSSSTSIRQLPSPRQRTGMLPLCSELSAKNAQFHPFFGVFPPSFLITTLSSMSTSTTLLHGPDFPAHLAEALLESTT